MHKAKHRKIKAKVTAPSPSKLTGKIKQKHIEKSWLEKKKKKEVILLSFPGSEILKKKEEFFRKKEKELFWALIAITFINIDTKSSMVTPIN